LEGDILFALQIVHQIKTEAHTQETGLLQMDVIMFCVQELSVGQFVVETLVIVSNLMGVR
jgi:hypothetical protein